MRTKKKILIVEDDKLVRNIVVKFLSKYYEVYWSENGRDGRDVCKFKEKECKHFDLILCDQGMPLMTGLEMYETLDDTHKRRFILWTGDTQLASPSGRKMIKGSSADDIFECVKTAIYQTKHRPPQADTGQTPKSKSDSTKLTAL